MSPRHETKFSPAKAFPGRLGPRTRGAVLILTRAEESGMMKRYLAILLGLVLLGLVAPNTLAGKGNGKPGSRCLQAAEQ